MTIEQKTVALPLHFLPGMKEHAHLPRFLAKIRVDPVSGCHLWTAALDNDGYGMIHLPAPSKLMRRAHRFAYRVFVANIPDGFELDHLCHTRDLDCKGGRSCQHRRCVRTDHLAPVRGRDNTLRGRGITAKEAQQTHCLRSHPFDGPNANVYLTKKGGRQCRTCKNITGQQRKAALAGQRPGVLINTERNSMAELMPPTQLMISFAPYVSGADR